MILPRTQSLGLWLAADKDRSYGHGEVVTAGWHDMTDAGSNDFTTYNSPTMDHNVKNGKPGILFDGSAAYMDGPGPGAIVGASAKTILVAFTPISVTSTLANASGDGIFCAQGFGFTLQDVGGTGTNYRLYIYCQDGTTDAVSFDNLTLSQTYVAWLFHDGATMYALLDTWDSLQSVASGAGAFSGNCRIGRNQGARYANVKVHEIVAYSVGLYGTRPDMNQIVEYGQARWLDRGDCLEHARDAGARTLFDLHVPPMKAKVGLDFRGVDIELGTDVGIMHPRLPMASDIQPSLDLNEPWRRETLRVAEHTINLDALTVTVKGPLIRTVPRTLWIPGQPRRSTDEKMEGAFHLAPLGGLYGGGRQSRALAARSSDDLVSWFGRPQPVVDAAGIIVSAAWGQSFIRNTFSSGTGGWTPSAGVTSETTADDFYFDDAVEDTNVVVTAANPHVADRGLSQNITLSAGWIGTGAVTATIQLAHKDSDEGPSVTLQRSSDNWYYQWDGTWAAAIAYYDFPARSAPTLDWVLADFTQAVAETFTIWYGAKSGGTASRTHKFYYAAQSGGVPYPMDHIQHLGSVGEGRTRDYYWVPNFAGARTVNAERGTILLRVWPFWDLTDDLTAAGAVAAGLRQTFGLFECWHSATNRLSAYIDQVNATLHFRLIVGGSTADATVALSAFGRDTGFVDVALRWCSSEGEHDLTAYTLSAFVAGAKGTDAVAAGTMTESDYSICLPGSFVDETGSALASAAIPLNGIIKDVHVLPICLSDVEIAARAA